MSECAQSIAQGPNAIEMPPAGKEYD